MHLVFSSKSHKIKWLINNISLLFSIYIYLNNNPNIYSIFKKIQIFKLIFYFNGNNINNNNNNKPSSRSSSSINRG